jgi:ribosomal protein S12 methylthiotransferase accessory factor YcaO-like protein
MACSPSRFSLPNSVSSEGATEVNRGADARIGGQVLEPPQGVRHFVKPARAESWPEMAQAWDNRLHDIQADVRTGLVDRDAASIWWYNQVSRPAIEMGSFGDAYFEALVADHAKIGWNLWLLDLTNDLNIPACVALAHRAEGDRFAIGFGCHVDQRLAVERALTRSESAVRTRRPGSCDASMKTSCWTRGRPTGRENRTRGEPVEYLVPEHARSAQQRRALS